jgi:hypothetical protein
MPPQYSSMSSRSVMPAGASLTPGSRTRPDTENERSPLRPCGRGGEPLGALLDDVAHPVQRLHSCARASAGRTGRPGRRRAGAGAACRACPRSTRSWPTPRRRCRRRRRAAARFGGMPAGGSARSARVLAQQRAAGRGTRRAGRCRPALDAHRPGGDQHAFEEAVRVALEVVTAVLEGAGLALVDVHRHQARRRLARTMRHLRPAGKAGAAQAAQARVLQRPRAGSTSRGPGRPTGGSRPPWPVPRVDPVPVGATGRRHRALKPNRASPSLERRTWSANCCWWTTTRP